MTPQRRRPLLLLVAVVLFVGWVSWLGYLALTTSQPEVLSRPQFLASQLDIVADVSGDEAGPQAAVTVEQVLWHAQEVPAPAVGAKIGVTNLPHVAAPDGWTGPGRYLLPLRLEANGYRIAPVLHSPGLARGHDRPRIYHATEQTLAQYRKMRGE
jgi:hypothetical protein